MLRATNLFCFYDSFELKQWNEPTFEVLVWLSLLGVLNLIENSKEELNLAVQTKY